MDFRFYLVTLGNFIKKKLIIEQGVSEMDASFEFILATMEPWWFKPELVYV